MSRLSIEQLRVSTEQYDAAVKMWLLGLSHFDRLITLSCMCFGKLNVLLELKCDQDLAIWERHISRVI